MATLHVFYGAHCDRSRWVQARIPDNYPTRLCWHEVEKPDPTTLALVDFYGIGAAIADGLPVLVSDSGNGDRPHVAKEINIVARALGITEWFAEI